MDLRNIAIIAHVDHGKTTLVDEMLKQSGSFRENQAVAERAMDSNDLERERGITILAKATSVEWKGIRVNIVDTPGHADFGGEVERILSMVDGVVLLVDAAEGPMPQTKFVTSKALALGLRPIVVVNKVDKRVGETIKALSRDGERIEQFRATKILASRGLTQEAIDVAEAGDIVSLAGMSKATVADTLCAVDVGDAIPAQPIDPPTITVTFTIDVDDEYSGAVIEKITGVRKGELVEMKQAGAGKTRIIAHVPSRGLIGYHGEFLTDTRGTGVLNRVFHEWAPHKGAIPGRRAGVLISMENGVSVAYAIFNLEDRGKFFIGSQENVYQGMIIGEHSRENDLEVNPLKGKKLTNVRASGTDEAVRLTTPVRMSLEEAIAYIDNDELVEVTPNAIRLRKRHLDPHERKRASRTDGQ